MAINWNQLRELISYYGPEVINYWSDPKQRFKQVFNGMFGRSAPTAPKSVRVAPKGRPEDIEEEYYNRWKNYENMNQGERVGKLNEYQNRGNFGRSQQMLKEVTQNQPASLENQRKIDHRFGPPSPAPTYGPSVRIETPEEFLNKPEQSTTNAEELRPTTPESELHFPMDEGARIETPKQFIKKPKKAVPKPIDLTSLPSFPKSEPVQKGMSDIDRKRFALLDTYGYNGLKSLNDDAYVERRFNAAMRGSRARQLQQNYNRQGGVTQQPAVNQSVQPNNPNMYRNMARTVQQPTPRFPGKDYYRNLGLSPQQIAARDARQEANKRRRMGYKA